MLFGRHLFLSEVQVFKVQNQLVNWYPTNFKSFDLLKVYASMIDHGLLNLSLGFRVWLAYWISFWHLELALIKNIIKYVHDTHKFFFLFCARV